MKKPPSDRAHFLPRISFCIAAAGMALFSNPIQAQTAGFDFFVDAGPDTDADEYWEDLTGGNPTGFDLLLDDDPAVVRVATSGSNTTLTHAYDFPGGSIDNEAGAIPYDSVAAETRSFSEAADGDWSIQSVSMELWVKPDNLTPTTPNGQIIFEDGGGTGLGIIIDDNELVVTHDAGINQIRYNLLTDSSDAFTRVPTSDFFQIVVTHDTTSPFQTVLYINGIQVGTSNNDGDWSGGDAAGFGTRGDANVGGLGGGQMDTETFDGQIALIRMYRAQILTPSEVTDNYDALAVPDATAPVITSRDPADGSSGAYPGAVLVATFDEYIELTGTGTITVTDGSDIRVIQLDGSPDDGNATVVNDQLIITVDTNLSNFNSNYDVLISSDAIENLADTPVAFAGTSAGDWDFTTVVQDLVAPSITPPTDPADDSTGVLPGATLTATFDKDIIVGSGDITINRLTAPAGTFATISVTDTSQISISGTQLIVSPATPFDPGVEYAVQIAAGAVMNYSDVDFAGISDDTTWSFTTAATYTWVETAGGAQSWNTAASWDTDPVVPNPISNDTVDFSAANIAGNVTLTLEADRTAGIWKFGDASGSSTWTVSAGNTMTLAGDDPTIQVTTNTTLQNVVAGTSGFKKTGGADLTMTGANTFTGGIELAAGQITVSNGTNETQWLGASTNILTFTGDAELRNSNGTFTMPQGIHIDGGVTATVSGAFGEDTLVDGVLSGTGTLLVQGYSAGFDARFQNTANTFTGPIEIQSGDGVIARFASLPDSPGPTTIGLDSQNNNGAVFEYTSLATSPLVLNNRQFELIENGNAGTNLGRQPGVQNSASGANTITVNTDLLITGTGTKKFFLSGGNGGANTFAGVIPDGVSGADLTLYKDNGGKWILTGVNTYEGDTNILNGTLEIGDAGQLGSGAYAGVVSIGSGDQFVVNSTAAQTLSGVISGAGALTKNNTGILTLTGVNTYTGGTNVEDGTLTIDGSLADASMTISGGTVDGSGSLNFNVNGTTADQVVVTGGTLDISGLAVEIVASGSGLTETEYVLVDANAGYTGTFTGLTGASGYALDYGTADQVKLVQTGGGTAYETWAGGAVFTDDDNGDGVTNGLAFLLGAVDPDEIATDRLPTVSESGGDLILTFNCLPVSARGTATLNVEHSSDLGISDAWLAVEVPDATSGLVNGVSFVVGAGPVGPPALNSVTATIDSAEAGAGKLFGRLEGDQP